VTSIQRPTRHPELHRGNVDAAERHFASSDASRNRDDPYEQAMMHLNLAAIALARAKPERAHDELERSTSILDTAGITLDPDDAFEVGWLRDQLGR
jgi:hypothetical protein